MQILNDYAVPLTGLLVFALNTAITYWLKSVTARHWLITLLKALVGALEKSTPAAILLLAFGLQGCAAAIPKPSSPCPGLYCLEWSGNEVGLPGSALICAKTDLELQTTVRALASRYPRATVRKVDAQ